ncbi:MAG: ATP-dependent DNA helicase RecG, partial [Lachnospiraceae bacterium]|nr:ATP-dependent DNA helicase RecG [Lachnospiraceae bacterium]
MNITALKGIGEKTSRLFAKLGITTTEELLRYYPKDYDKMQEPVAIANASIGERIAVRGTITGNMALTRVRNLNILNFVIQDASGSIQMTYFNMPYLKNTLKKNTFYIFRGQLLQKGNKLVMEQAQIYKPEEYVKLLDRLLPKYVLTKGLSNNAITKAVTQALAVSAPEEEYLPEALIERHQLIPRQEAIVRMHFPQDKEMLLIA